MKWRLTPLAAPLLGIASPALAEPGYSYETVQVPMPAVSVRGDPAAPFRALSDLAWQRSAREALKGTRLGTAYQGGSPLGRGGLMVVFSITPQRGVFYIMPNGPYPLSGGGMVPVPTAAKACRMVVKWSALGGGPIVSRLDRLTFPDSDCKVPAADPDFIMPQSPMSAHFSAGPGKRIGAATLSLLTLHGGIGLFDPARPFAALLKAQGDSLAMMIPLNGLAGQEVVYARSKKGRTFVLIEDQTNSLRTCLIEGLSWAQISDHSGLSGLNGFFRPCMDLTYADDHSRPPLDPHPDITTQEVR